MSSTYKTIAGAGGDGGGRAGGGQEAPDSLQSRAMLSILDLVGEGQIGGLVNGAASIYLDDTPILNPDGSANYRGVTWSSRDGTQDQTVIPGFGSVESAQQVGVKIKKDQPYTFTITNRNASQVRVIISVPQLMIIDDEGNTNGGTVEYRLEVSVDGGPFVNSSAGAISGKTRSKYQRNITLALPAPASSWSVRITRLTADSTDTKTMNDLYIESYAEITNSPLRYPNSALVALSIDSSQLSKIPKRSYLVQGLYIRVPSNYNAITRAYGGIWDGTFALAASDNPAWILYDLLTNERYGLGQFIAASQVNKSKLYQIGRHCDELVPDGFGGFEPRLTINTAIQNQSEAYRLISEITSVFRGMGYWDGGMVDFTIDAPTDPSMVFSQANVIDGLFSYSGSARTDRHSVALITWNDPADRYKQRVEYVEDRELIAKYGIRKLETVAFGCTSRGQAHRVGLWMLYTEKYESDVITFKVGHDAAGVLPGEVVKVHDSFRAGKRMGGRLKGATLTSATLDAGVTLTSSEAIISIRMPDGSFAERTIEQSPGEVDTVSWAAALPEMPVANAIWLMAEKNLQPMLARVVGVQQGSDAGTCTITAVEHNPSKYNAIEHGLALEVMKNSVVDANAVIDPSNPNVTEEEYVVVPGVMGTRLSASWSGMEPTYEITWRRRGKYATEWVTVSSTSPLFELENVRAGTYEFSLLAVNGLGRKSRAVTFQHIVTGRTTAPGDVPNLQARRRATDIVLTWDPALDMRVLGYEVRFGRSWDDSVVLTTRFSGTTMTHDVDTGGTFYYHIRSIDVNGQYSDNVSTAQLTLAAPGPVRDFVCVQSGDRLEFKWTDSTDTGLVGYEIREGLAWSTAKLLTQVTATTYTTPANSVVGSRIFWIKAVVAPGIPSKVATFATADIALPSDRNLIFTDEEHVDGWLGSKYQLTPVDGALQLDNNTGYGEYTWGVNLPKSYRARNSIDSQFGAVLFDATSWQSAPWSWSASNASRGWAVSGDINSISLTYYISKFTGLTADYVEGFGLNKATVGEMGTVADESVGVTYGSGRFLAGAKLNDFTRLGWTIAIPAVFNTTLWVIPQSIAGNQVYWTGSTATGLRLICGYDAPLGAFYLEDTLGNKITVPYAIAANDRVLLAIAQTATERKLYVGALTREAAHSSAMTAPIGAVTRIGLNQ